MSLLAALPAHSLTHLDLSMCNGSEADSLDAAAVAAVLGRLSNLQRLELSKPEGMPMKGSCITAIGQLTKLTYLWLDSEDWLGPNEQLQQMLAHPPPLRHLFLQPHESLPVLDLSSMTHMEELTIKHDLPTGSALPTRLRELHLEVYYSADIMSAVLPLHQLQRLTLFQGFAEQQPLLQVAQLPSLQQLSLHYWNAKDAAGSATAWAQVPQLCALTVLLHEELPLPSTMAAILDALAACTQLTTLRLEAAAALPSEDYYRELQPVAACSKLAGLKHLRDLHIKHGSKLVPGDVRAVTALTGLTRLVLAHLDSAVDDVAATALACSLKQLQYLDLAWCELGQTVCFAAIGQLRQLTELDIFGVAGVTPQGLLLLTGLSRLQQLRLDMCAGVEDEHVQEFWAAVQPKC